MAIKPTKDQRKEALVAIARFCRIPYMQQGVQAKSGPRKYMYPHDWGNIVRDVSIIAFGKRANLDYVSQRMVGSLVRDEFPNSPDWNRRVKPASAQEAIFGNHP